MSRLLIAVSHLLGAGHLTRASAIGRAFARAGHEVTLVNGGVPAPLISLDGLKVVQLPALRATWADFKTLLDEHGARAAPEHLAERRRILLETLAATRPDVVLTELFPFGRRTLSDELMALVEAAHAMRPRPLILSSLRDILERPKKPERVVEARGRATAFYDALLVHGDPELVALDESWPVDESIRPLLHWTGYVHDGAAIPAPPHSSDDSARTIVVSGGSSGAGIALYRAALGAAAVRPQLSWHILVGAGAEQTDFASLSAGAPANAIVERARPDFLALLARCAVSVSQLGYNTAVDILRANPRAVFVPFEGVVETEQPLRARRLSAWGWGTVLPERELSPQTLAAAVDAALRAPRSAPSPVRIDGAERTVAIVEELLARRWR